MMAIEIRGYKGETRGLKNKVISLGLVLIIILEVMIILWCR